MAERKQEMNDAEGATVSSSSSANADKGLKIEPNEGARMRSLKESINNTVEKILRGHKSSVYAQCFPSLVKKNEAVLESVRVALVDKVRDAIYEDLEQLIESSDIAEPLEKLSNLVKSHTGPTDVKAWRPSGDPLADMRAHDAKVLLYEKQKLLETLSREQKKTEDLYMKVCAGREQCRNNSVEIQNRLSTLSKVRDTCNSLSKSHMVEVCEENLTSYDG